MPTAAEPMFRRAMGDAAFARLALPLQRFHGLHGRHTLTGEATTLAPQNAVGRLLCRLLGAPSADHSGPVRFELDASPEIEHWTRHFPGPHTMRSRLQLDAGQVVERLGPARLTFTLAETAGRLEMRLAALRFLGVPCPAALRPRLRAVEHGDGDRLHFDIEAALPLGIGRVVGYRGWLAVPGEVPP